MDFIAHSRADIPWLVARVRELEKALVEAKTEIEYEHEEMLSPEEREHPRGSGWARVYDKINAALEGK